MKAESKEWQAGYDRTRGIIRAIMQELGKIIGWGILAHLIFFCLIGAFTDDTDKSGWKRSGVTLITDYGTGQQYLYRGGAIIKREPKP